MSIYLESVKQYCCEDISLIENYDIAISSSETYDCHHRLEIQDGKTVMVDELKSKNLYFHRPASELIFLQHIEHIKLHAQYGFLYRNERISKAKEGHLTSEITREKIRNSRLLHNSQLTAEEWKKEYSCTEETKQKISRANKDRKPKPVSEETRRKLSERSKERWQNPEYRETISKKISESVKRTYTNEHKRRISEACKGRKMSQEFRDNCRKRMTGKRHSEETKAKMRASHKPLKPTLGFHWYTNGVINKSCLECPDGFWLGRTVTKIVSEETRAKMRASHRARQEAIRNGKS